MSNEDEQPKPLEVIESFWEAGEKLYRDAHKPEVLSELKTLRRCTLQELRRAFRPGARKSDILRVAEKVVPTARLIIGNSDLVNQGVEPSCSEVGLHEPLSMEEEVHERCSVLETNGFTMSCDCPKGREELNPKEFAREHLVFNVDERPEMLYSDYPGRLGKCYRLYMSGVDKGDWREITTGLDCMIGAVHGSGKMARWFVHKGQDTLDTLARE